MSIIFNVAPVGAQKGGTCWYYVSKMLVNFHDIRNTNNKEWRALHQLREVISELDADSPLLGEGAMESLNWFQGRLMATFNEVDGPLRQYDQWAREPGFYAKQQATIALSQINKKFTTLAEARQKRDEVLLARQKVNLLQSNSRIEILQAFMTPGLFSEEQVPADTLTSQEIETRLRSHGPFYAGGNLSASRSNLKVRSGQGLGTTDSRANVYQMDEGGHAVMVVGVQRKTILYKDPHNSRQIRMINVSTFVKQWRQNSPTCTLVKLTCPQATAVVGGCPHGQARLLLNQV
jgi:hypothetical protein